MRGFFRDLIVILIVTFLIFMGRRLMIGSYAVVSPAMEPGIRTGQRILVNKLAYKVSEPERGDIVYYRTPEGGRSQMKRLIGLPGDIVQIDQGVVFLNGHQLSEPYVSEPAGYTLSLYQIPSGCYFVLGDNRNNSNDSHDGWTVPSAALLGKAWILSWPPDEWGSAGNYNLTSQLATAEASDTH